jgi:predicted RNase H-like HicB family nuclease
MENPMETVRVIYHHEAGCWWAESPDIKGWSAAGDTFAEIKKLAEEGVPFALGRDAKLEHCPPAGGRVTA